MIGIGRALEPILFGNADDHHLGLHSVGVLPMLQLEIAVTSAMLEGLSVMHYDLGRRVKSSQPGATA